MTDPEYVVAEANRLAAESRRGGAPRLTVDSTREALIAWLMWNDPNACWADDLAAIEGFDPLTIEDAWGAVGAVVQEFGRGAE